MRRPVEVAVDANFLMLPMVKRINLVSELDRLLTVRYRLVVPRCVVEELERLEAQGRLLERRRARFALSFIKGLGMEVVDSPPSRGVDEALAQGALSHRWVVATNDRGLKSKLRRLGVPVICLRGGKKLALEGDLEGLEAKA
jgi:rRNA-processing protein FCF1